MKNKKILIIFVIAILLCLLGTTYAFFNYYKIGSNQEIIAGKVALKFVEDVDTISLTNVFPETTEEARKRDDNFVTFTISGTNTTTNKDVFYQIMLNEGADEDGKKRFKPNELVFDLVEIDENNNETYLVDAMYFNDLNAQRIWVDIVEREETTGINKTYKLRMWINDDVLVSDSYPNADYTTEEFANGYASVKVSVQGDFNEKASVYNYMKARFSKLDLEASEIESLWPAELDEMVTQFTEIRFMSMEKEMLDMLVLDGAIDLTDTTKSPAGSVIAIPLPDSTGEGYALTIMSDGITMLPENSNGLFALFQSVKQIHFNNVNTKGVTNMQNMFFYCSNLTNLNLSHFNTKSVTNLSCMFQWCENLASLNISGWNTESVTNMSKMFQACGNLGNLDVSSFNTNNVTNMSGMFQGCISLIKLDVSHFNTSNVTDMSWMFGSVNLDELDLSTFDVGKDTVLTGMFNGVEIKRINLSGWRFTDNNIGQIRSLRDSVEIDLSNCDVSAVTDMSELFDDFDMLKELNLSGWDTSNVTDMRKMFSGCTGLTTLDLSNLDTGNVTNMEEMFSFCTSLTKLDLSNFDTRNVTNMFNMFWSCSNLSYLDISNFTFDSITSYYYQYMFRDMKDRVDNTPTIIVKSETEQNWVLSLKGDNRPSSWTTDNVIIG